MTMVEPVTLDEKLLRECRQYYIKHLNQNIIGFYSAISQIDDSPSPFGSRELSMVSESFEKFLATYKAFNQTISGNGSFGEPSPEKMEFLELYSLFAGAAEGLESLKKATDENEKEVRIPTKHRIDFTAGSYTLIDNLIKTYLEGIKGLKSSEALAAATKDYFEWVISEANERAESSEFDNLNDAARETYIKIDGIVINGLSYISGSSIKAWSQTRTTINDIVGNSDMIRVLQNGVKHIIWYDPLTKTNCHEEEYGEFPKTFTFFGDAGQGKSVTIEAMLNYAQGLAEKNRKPLEVIDLSAFKSKFYSESAENLRKVFDRVEKGEALYIIIAEDIDTLFYSRSNQHGSNEDKNNLNVIMNKLEGVFKTNKGNYIFIATTNYPVSDDVALPDRLREQFHEVKGPETAEDYAALFQIKLRKVIENGYIKLGSKEWKQIGEKCLGYMLTGRAVKDISKRVIDALTSSESGDNGTVVSDSDEFLYNAEGFERIKEAYKKSRSIDSKRLIGLVDDYYHTLRKAEDAHRRNQVDALKQRILIEQQAYKELADQGKLHGSSAYKG